MTTKCVEVLEERLDGEVGQMKIDFGEKFISIDGQFSEIEGRLGGMEDLLKQLVASQHNPPKPPEERNSPNPNPNPNPNFPLGEEGEGSRIGEEGFMLRRTQGEGAGHTWGGQGQVDHGQGRIAAGLVASMGGAGFGGGGHWAASPSHGRGAPSPMLRAPGEGAVSHRGQWGAMS